MGEESKQPGGVGGFGGGARLVALGFQNSSEQTFAPQVEASYCAAPADLKNIYCGEASFEYAGRRSPIFIGMNNRAKILRFGGVNLYLNGVIKGGPVFVKNLGFRTGGRAEAGFGFLTPVGGRNIFWDFNMGPHLYYDNQKGGDFWNKAKFSPAVVLGASFFLEN